MMEFDYDYDVELFNYEDGVEVYSIHNYTCDHDISEDEIEDSIDTYYARGLRCILYFVFFILHHIHLNNYSYPQSHLNNIQHLSTP